MAVLVCISAISVGKMGMDIPTIMHKPGAVGGKAAVNDIFIQRLFVELLTGVLIERTEQKVVAVFAYECLHIGNIFLKVLPSGVMLLHENISLHIYYFKGKIQLCLGRED